MSVGDSRTNVVDQFQGLETFDLAILGGSFEGFSRDELHHEVEHFVDNARIEDRDEVGMAEPGHRLGGGFKGPPEIRVETGGWGQNFDGDVAFRESWEAR